MLNMCNITLPVLPINCQTTLTEAIKNITSKFVYCKQCCQLNFLTSPILREQIPHSHKIQNKCYYFFIFYFSHKRNVNYNTKVYTTIQSIGQNSNNLKLCHCFFVRYAAK